MASSIWISGTAILISLASITLSSVTMYLGHEDDRWLALRRGVRSTVNENRSGISIPLYRPNRHERRAHARARDRSAE